MKIVTTIVSPKIAHLLKYMTLLRKLYNILAVGRTITMNNKTSKISSKIITTT